MKEPPVLTGCDVLPPPTSEKCDGPASQRRAGTSPLTTNRFFELNSFVDVTLRDLGGTEAKVWMILWRDTKSNGKVATSQTDLAKRAGVSVRSIYTALKTLESKRLLTQIRKGRIGTGASVYRVLPLAKF